MKLDALLAPLPGASPCGEDLAFSPEFDAILEWRREDDASIDQGDWVRPLKVADWMAVANRCESLLATRSKDLRLIAWLTDAAARLDGFEGLADGLAVAAGLCESQWDGLHPLAVDGDQDQRIGNLNWLLMQLPTLCRMTMQRHPGAAGLPDLERAQSALARLEACVDAQLGQDGPNFGPSRLALQEAHEALARMLAGEKPAATASASTAPAMAVTGPLGSRAQALAQLRQVADFFRATEPHSPVAYLAEKAARWGEMPLHDWLRSVLNDPGALARIEEQLGIEPRPPQ